MRIEPLTDWPERLTEGATLFLEGEERPMRIGRLDAGGRVPVVHLDGIDTRDAAEALRGRYLEGPAVRLAAGEYFWDDLVGLRVEAPDGTPIGDLVEVFRAGGNEVYRVVGESGERLVPALRSVVRRIDLEAGLMVVTTDEAEEVR